MCMAVAATPRYADLDAAGRTNGACHDQPNLCGRPCCDVVPRLGARSKRDLARGGFGGRSFGFSPGFRPSALRTPFLAHGRFGSERLRRHDGLGVPLTVLGGAAYGPSDYVDPYFRPADAEPDLVTGAIPGGGNPVFVYRRGCFTQTVTVPSESGGKRAINIARCNSCGRTGRRSSESMGGGGRNALSLIAICALRPRP